MTGIIKKKKINKQTKKIMQLPTYLSSSQCAQRDRRKEKCPGNPPKKEKKKENCPSALNC